MADVKTVNGLALASMKTRNGLAAASLKTINGLNAEVASGFGGSVDTANLIDWWPMDEASGNRAGAHASLTLTDYNTVTSNTGVGGTTAAQFTSVNDEMLYRSHEAALAISGSFTVVAWVYLDDKTEGAPKTIFSKYNTGQYAVLLIFAGGASGPFRLYVSPASDGTGTNSVDSTTFGSPSTGTWYFVAARHRSGTNIGISVNAGTENTFAHTAGVYNGTAPFEFGKSSGVGTWLWNGRMQRCGVWTRVLSDAELTALYNSGSGLDY